MISDRSTEPYHHQRQDVESPLPPEAPSVLDIPDAPVTPVVTPVSTPQRPTTRKISFSPRTDAAAIEAVVAMNNKVNASSQISENEV